MATISQANIDDLRRALRELSELGVSYANVCDSINPSFSWNANGIKQFVSRSGVTRVTPRVSALSHAVLLKINSLDNKNELSRFDELSFSLKKLAAVEQSSLGDLKDESFGDDEKSSLDFSIRLEGRYGSLKRRSCEIEIPSSFAFVRYTIDPKKIIVVQVNTQMNILGRHFVMKIAGSRGRKRIVIGSMLSTTQNTYFQGISYHVNRPIENHAFEKLDAFDLDTVVSVTSQNVVGMELIAISNSNLYERVTPACFTGLDGGGNPITGIGIFIVREDFNYYSIDESILSVLECAENNAPLQETLQNAGAFTKRLVQSL